MRLVVHETVASAASDEHREHQAGRAGGYVHDIASGEVERADDIADERSIAAPYHMRERSIDQRHPEDYE